MLGLILAIAITVNYPPYLPKKGGRTYTRDGRIVGLHCNPCSEEPKPGYKAPVIPPKDWETMAGPCSPKGIGKGKPATNCVGKK